MARNIGSSGMQSDRLTIKVQEALQQAQAIAQRRDHQRLEPEHILLALLEQEQGFVRQIIEKSGVGAERFQAALTAALDKVPAVSGDVSLHLSNRASKLLLNAEDEAKRLTDEYVSTEHLLLASFKDEDLGRQ